MKKMFIVMIVAVMAVSACGKKKDPAAPTPPPAGDTTTPPPAGDTTTPPAGDGTTTPPADPPK